MTTAPPPSRRVASTARPTGRLAPSPKEDDRVHNSVVPVCRPLPDGLVLPGPGDAPEGAYSPVLDRNLLPDPLGHRGDHRPDAARRRRGLDFPDSRVTGRSSTHEWHDRRHPLGPLPSP